MYRDLQVTVSLAMSAVVCKDPYAQYDLDDLAKLYAELQQGATISDVSLLISVWYQFDESPTIIEDASTYELLKPLLTVEELWCISNGKYQEKLVDTLDWAPIKVKDICTMLRETRASGMESWLADCIEYSETN